MSDRPVLYIGNYNYSSWSLRAWLALRFMGIEFDVVRIPLDTPEFPAQVRAISAAARVPVLRDGDLTVWDSLAICEYAAERAAVPGWPADRALRTHARCAVAEMHSGLTALRAAMPMNIRARRVVVADDAVARDIERLQGLWCEALTLHDGGRGWLYGERGIADAFFAPVLLRLRTYGVPVPELCRPWMAQLLEDPHMVEWCDAAMAESEVVVADEAGVPVDGDPVDGDPVEGDPVDGDPVEGDPD
ncbi:MAG TPA: glutathione S-transferase N-terminal domain-containing protein [Pseudomonadales bacterium]|nr:glutathione S-transferase N-terminal domain-containing protein [Pseudomonadales bacterium]